MGRIKKWEQWEIDILHANWNIPIRELLIYLPDRDRKTIYWKLGVLGYRRETFRRYTAEDDLYIKENYQTKGNFEIGRHLLRTAKSITKRMIILGLKRSPQDLKFIAKDNRGCYKAGRVSEKEVPNGNLRLSYDEQSERSYYDIKIDKKFVRFSRYLYEKYHQIKLSPTDIVFHEDGDSMNVLKENLVRLTRSQLLSKNNMTDEAFVKRIFRIKDPRSVAEMVEKHQELIKLKKNMFKLKSKLNESRRKTN